MIPVSYLVHTVRYIAGILIINGPIKLDMYLRYTCITQEFNHLRYTLHLPLCLQPSDVSVSLLRRRNESSLQQI